MHEIKGCILIFMYLFLSIQSYGWSCDLTTNYCHICENIKHNNKSHDHDLLKNNFSEKIHNLIKSYQNYLSHVENNAIIWKDGSEMIFDDGKEEKDYETLLNSPDLEDQMKFIYPKGSYYKVPGINIDPGRIRYEQFFKKMYGGTKEEVKNNLTLIRWLPKGVNKKILITSINDVHKRLQEISDEIDRLPHLYKYVNDPAGTFYWRTINNTNRLSPHSFGIAIDINVSKSSYWEWDKKNNYQNLFVYKNQIPFELVEIFEKHGFIWGGKWYHYDTMHFEYRPELLLMR